MSRQSYDIFPLGDAALTIDFGNCIDTNINKEVTSRFHDFHQHPLPGMIETVPAYSSLTIHYDLFQLSKKVPEGKTVAEWMKDELTKRLATPASSYESKGRNIRIPVRYCKDTGPDILRIVMEKGITTEELIAIHTATTYRVFMLGFLPGFPYLGTVDERIAMPRKPQPVNVAAGSVGIAGRQTGIYPLASPGGWQIIGRTPLELFDAEKTDPTLLQAGDTVQFYSITQDEFESY